MSAIDKHARTGRTTRLLQEARRLSDEGRAVYVIVPSDDLVKAFQTEEFRRRGIKVETVASMGNLEMETMRLRGAHPNCAVLVDHYVIECRFRPMLEMLHRFDLPAEGRRAPGSVTFDYKRFEQMADRSIQSAIESSSMAPPEGYHELEGKAGAVADDCFLAGVQAMKTAMLNAMFDELNGNGPIDPTATQGGENSAAEGPR